MALDFRPLFTIPPQRKGQSGVIINYYQKDYQ